MFLYGSDPELFVLQNKTILAATTLFPQPIPFPFGSITHDGTAVELHPNPSKSPFELIRNTMQLKDELKKLIPQDSSLLIEPIVGFNNSQSKSEYTIQDAGQVMQARKYFNADTGKEHIAKRKKKDSGTSCRTGAGHIHIGIGNDFKGTINTPKDLHDNANNI